MNPPISIHRKAFWKDKIAIGFTLVGIVLMIFTVLWHINPAEGSVVPHFLRESSIGRAAILILYITSLPVWICLFLLNRIFLALGFPNGIFPDTPSLWPFACIMITSQAIVYFMIGRLLSVCRRKLREKTGRSDPEQPPA